MTRGEAGLQLSEGLRVTYERTTNTRGPIAHYVKVGEAEAPAPPAPPPPKGSRNPYQRWRDSQYSERHGVTHAEKREAWLAMSHGERTRQAALIGFRIPNSARPRWYVRFPISLGTWNAVGPFYQMTNFDKDCIMCHDPAPTCLTLEEVAAFSVTYLSALDAVRIDMRAPSFVEGIKTETKAKH